MTLVNNDNATRFKWFCVAPPNIQTTSIEQIISVWALRLRNFYVNPKNYVPYRHPTINVYIITLFFFNFFYRIFYGNIRRQPVCRLVLLIFLLRVIRIWFKKFTIYIKRFLIYFEHQDELQRCIPHILPFSDNWIFISSSWWMQFIPDGNVCNLSYIPISLRQNN